MATKASHSEALHPHLAYLAVVGLVASSFIATLGVAAVGVQAQVAFAQYQGPAIEAAAVMLGDSRASAQPMRDPTIPAAASNAPSTASSSMPAMPPHPVPSNAVAFCPKISNALQRGSQDASSTEDVRQLQLFLTNRYGLDASSTVSGYFGSTTQAYVEKFQQEQGIPPAPAVGKLTLAAIAKLCGSGPGDPPQQHMGSSTPMMGSTTPPMPPRGNEHPAAPTTAKPVTIQNYQGSSNAAAVVSAMAEIEDGYGKLLGATISLLGL